MWNSETLNQKFVFVESVPVTVSASRYSGCIEVFTGVKARRQGDHVSALVKLTEKPKDYPYDFVLL